MFLTNSEKYPLIEFIIHVYATLKIVHSDCFLAALTFQQIKCFVLLLLISLTSLEKIVVNKNNRHGHWPSATYAQICNFTYWYIIAC